MENVREPKQKRAIEKKEKIIKAGFDLICKNGYYNINTADIAKEANCSTGIVYQYFNDKHDILIEGLYKYGENIFYPMIKIPSKELNVNEFTKFIKNTIDEYINNHKISKIAHKEIMSMVHTDEKVAEYYYDSELKMTNTIKKYLISSDFKDNNLNEKIHIMLGMIDNLCHEIIYHKHANMDYNIMINIVVNNINNIFKNDLK